MILTRLRVSGKQRVSPCLQFAENGNRNPTKVDTTFDTNTYLLRSDLERFELLCQVRRVDSTVFRMCQPRGVGGAIDSFLIVFPARLVVRKIPQRPESEHLQKALGRAIQHRPAEGFVPADDLDQPLLHQMSQ